MLEIRNDELLLTVGEGKDLVLVLLQGLDDLLLAGRRRSPSIIRPANVGTPRYIRGASADRSSYLGDVRPVNLQATKGDARLLP